MRVSAVTSLTAGRWFCDGGPLRVTPVHPARRDFGEHPWAHELSGGMMADSSRSSLAAIFAQHFREPSLGELPLH